MIGGKRAWRPMEREAGERTGTEMCWLMSLLRGDVPCIKAGQLVGLTFAPGANWRKKRAIISMMRLTRRPRGLRRKSLIDRGSTRPHVTRRIVVDAFVTTPLVISVTGSWRETSKSNYVYCYAVMLFGNSFWVEHGVGWRWWIFYGELLQWRTGILKFNCVVKVGDVL